ncbi:uncharacterized protein AMSG_04076 [Thecamonas trahens ATCC 50062]|uniref:Uncharacterized protein n=1 Tax=Thecamonas trahens ATCC 50062 TaxID=461836 RepID=A0A0L0D6W9_THETB|nr:hypothetical protein AMSG_04076 [Thecamonas trahens ATCC 50062]KNC47846.1 hypothetical protein AMSG_04076 [Thecamonas trahens ATCC 50062]|eukprot:XP_013759324.1 hypothetical protein AMSG_04076 [Thecamonas trahens ATCC 50062]
MTKAGERRLRKVARSGVVRRLKPLLRKANAGNLDLNAVDAGGTTAAHTAAERGHVPVVLALARAGADLYRKDARGRNVLDAAAAAGQTAVVEALIAPPPFALVAAEPVCAKATDDQDPPVVSDPQDGSDALIGDDAPAAGASQAPRPVTAVRGTALMRTSGDHAPGETSPLLLATKAGALGVVKVLLRLGANPDQVPGPHGRLPLHWACAKANVDITAALLDGGADPYALTSDGESAIDIAGSGDVARLVRLAQLAPEPEPVLDAIGPHLVTDLAADAESGALAAFMDYAPAALPKPKKKRRKRRKKT